MTGSSSSRLVEFLGMEVWYVGSLACFLQNLTTNGTSLILSFKSGPRLYYNPAPVDCILKFKFIIRDYYDLIYSSCIIMYNRYCILPTLRRHYFIVTYLRSYWFSCFYVLQDKSIQQLCDMLPAPTCRLLNLCLDDNRRITSASLSQLFQVLPRRASKREPHPDM